MPQTGVNQQIKQESEDGFKSLATGAKVEYELEADPKNPEKKVAVNVTGVDGTDCEAKAKGKENSSEKKENEKKTNEKKTNEKKTEKKTEKGKGKKGEGKKGKGKKSSEDEEEE